MTCRNLISLLTILLLLQTITAGGQAPIVRRQLMLARFDSRPISKVRYTGN